MNATGTTPEPHRVAEEPTAPRAARPPRRRRLAAVLTAVAATALAGGSLAATAAPAQAATLYSVTSVVDGGRYTLSDSRSGLVLDNPGGSNADGTVPIGWEANGGFNQVWKFAAAGGGYYKIINNASGKCLDLLGGTGTTIGQYLCDANGVNQPNQLWLPVSVVGGFEVRLKLNSRPLSLIGGNAALALHRDRASLWHLSPTSYSVTTSRYSLRAGQAASVLYACDGPNFDYYGSDYNWQVRTEGSWNFEYQNLSDKGMAVSASYGDSRTNFRVSYTNSGVPAQRREGQVRFYCDPKEV